VSYLLADAVLPSSLMPGFYNKHLCICCPLEFSFVPFPFPFFPTLRFLSFFFSLAHETFHVA
jgi:hypothetical protein